VDEEGGKMLMREARAVIDNPVFTMGDLARNRSLALFTESIMSLLSSPTAHGAMIDLVSLMGQTFPQAGPALYVMLYGSETQAYSVLGYEQGGTEDATRVLGSTSFVYTSVPVGGHPPLMGRRIDLVLVDTTKTRVILSISSGIHDGIFQEWVKILTPAVSKLMDHEVLLHMAYRDGLTGLLNYRALEEMLKSEQDRASRYGTSFSLMMVDIDWFKKINDTYGHQIGDVVLRSLADRVNACVRKSDRVFRYGGEEFAILLPHTGIAKAGKLAQRMRFEVEHTDFIAGLKITVSIGISEHREGLSAFDIVKQADRGLYLAKEKGRNRVEVMRENA
jgi:diguanylate cyclase (GGDEF)-like protein